MDTKISHEFWSDADVEQLTPEQRLTALWLMTNSKVSLAGFTNATTRRFEFETGLAAEALERTIQALPKTFEKIGCGVWIRNFIRRQLGDGPALAKNKVSKGLIRELEALSNPLLMARVLQEYPALSPLRSSAEIQMPLASPPQGVPMHQSRAEQSRAEQNSGSAEGENPVDPSNLSLHQAKTAISELLSIDPTRPWSYEGEQALARICPLPIAELEAVRWLHRQTPSDTRPKLRSNPTSLCTNWLEEVAKAQGLAAMAGIDLSRTGQNFAKKETGGPAGWEEWLREKYPAALIPETFAELPREIRAEATGALSPVPTEAV